MIVKIQQHVVVAQYRMLHHAFKTINVNVEQRPVNQDIMQRKHSLKNAFNVLVD